MSRRKCGAGGVAASRGAVGESLRRCIPVQLTAGRREDRSPGRGEEPSSGLLWGRAWWVPTRPAQKAAGPSNAQLSKLAGGTRCVGRQPLSQVNLHLILARPPESSTRSPAWGRAWRHELDLVGAVGAGRGESALADHCTEFCLSLKSRKSGE